MKQLDILAICICFLFSGCTNKDIYDIGREHNRQSCLKRDPNRYDECIRETSTVYEDYEEDRAKTLKE